ncbi:MAG: endonuclease III [Vicinamibacterales bacterium]
MSRPKPAVVERVMRTLAREIDGMELPAIEKISESQQEDPFQVLIATLLSARTQDATTHAASTRLFRRARTPRSMARLSTDEIEKLIYPVSFYRNKAQFVRETASILATRYKGRVPDTLEELVTLPGVGRKTATLVMILAFQSQRHVCVDTHVHRISNRLGWVKTRTPDQTEQALYRNTDARWWPYINLYLVTWGQNVCRPVYPRCRGAPSPWSAPAGARSRRPRASRQRAVPRTAVSGHEAHEHQDTCEQVHDRLLRVRRHGAGSPRRQAPAACLAERRSRHRRRDREVRSSSRPTRTKRRRPSRASSTWSSAASTAASGSTVSCRTSSCSWATRPRATLTKQADWGAVAAARPSAWPRSPRPMRSRRGDGHGARRRREQWTASERVTLSASAGSTASAPSSAR